MLSPRRAWPSTARWCYDQPKQVTNSRGRNKPVCKHRQSIFRLLGAVLLSLPPVIWSQEAKPAPAPIKDGGPGLRVTSRLVYVDVVVRDGAGVLVHGLERENFNVGENKQPQRVVLFEEHTSAMQAASYLRRIAAKQQTEYSNVAPGAQDTALNMVLLDFLNTSPQDQQFARKRMIAFLKAMPAGRQVALFVLSNGLHMVQGFTTDGTVLAKAADAIEPRQMNRLRTPGKAVTDLDTSAYVDAQLGAGAGTGSFSAGALLQKYSLLEDIQNMKARLDATNAAFRELSRAVSGYPGRKNLYWLAGQFPSSNYYDLQTLSTSGVAAIQTPGGPRINVSGGQDKFAGTTSTSGLALNSFSERADREMADSQVAVYPISLVGLQTDNVGADQMGIGTTGDNASQTSLLYFNERATGRAVMGHIAEETGGEAFYGNNDPALLLGKGFEDGENYYTLAYQPTNHTWDGRYRSIAVTLRQRGYHLSYRRGYVALPERAAGDAVQQFAAAMRIESPPSTQVVLRCAVPAVGADGTVQLPVVLDLHGIDFSLDEATGDRRAKLQVLVVGYPETSAAKPVQSNSVLDLGLTAEDYRKYLEASVPLQLQVKIGQGAYALRIGVLDVGSQRIGTLTIAVTR